MASAPLPPECLDRIMAARGWLSRMPGPARRQLIAAAELRPYAAGAAIVSAGQDGGGPFGLVQGRVGCWASSRFAEPTLGRVAIPGDWFGEGPALLGIPRTISFRALEPSTLLYLPAIRMRQLSEAEPDLLHQFAKLSETAAQIMAGLIAELLIPDTERRLAIQLVRTARTELDLGPAADAPLPLGQAALAELVGTSRSNLNRILRRWVEQGLVETGYNRIRPLAPGRLLEIASGDPA